MGNQIVCPSGQSWYLDDLNSMGMKIQKSIFDGTFMLSFVTADARSNQQFVVKIIQINDKKYRNLAENFLKMFARMKNTSPEILYGNVFPTPYLTRSGAYMVRDYLDMSLCDRMVSDPVLEHSEKLWISFQLLRIVKNLHAERFRHGDIKPENVFISPRGFVSLVDHAPFKPLVIGRNQPHYFIHFFSYGRGSCFLAPERFVGSGKRRKVNEFALDWFSIGCVMAYIFTNGKYLFDFTSVLQYGDGDDSCLKILDEIEDEKIRAFILLLIDRNPLKRIKAAETMTKYFPDWFGVYFDFNVFSSLDSKPVDVVYTKHKQILSMIGDDVEDQWIIYLQAIGEALMRSNTIDVEIGLLQSYGELAVKIKSVTVKITRIITRLVSLLDHKSSAVSVYAFGYIFDVLKTIDSVPDIFADVGRLYLLPRIVVSLQNNQNWNFWFTSELPNVLHEMSRIWPDLPDIFPKTPQFFMPLISTSMSKEKDPRKEAVVRSFMHNAKKVVSRSSYPVVRALCFVILQLSNNASNLPVVADFVRFCASHLMHTSFIMFRAEFSSGFQNALFGFVGDEKYNVSCVMNALLAVLQKQKAFLPLQLALFKMAVKAIDYNDPEMTYLSRRIIATMPEQYQRMAAAAMLQKMAKQRAPVKHNKEERKVAAAPLEEKEPDEPHDEETQREDAEESQGEEPKSEVVDMPPPPEHGQATCFAAEYKAFSWGIQNIIARQNVMFAAAGGTISQLSVDWKAEKRVRTRLKYRSTALNNLKSIDFCDKSLIAATYDRGIEILSCNRFDKRSIFDTRLKIKQTTIFHREYVCLTFESAGSTVHVMNLENSKKVASFPIRETIRYMGRPMNGFLLPLVTASNRVIFIDQRVRLCVAEHACSDGDTVIDLHPYYGTKYIARTESGYYYYDVANPVSPFFEVIGHADFSMISNPDNKGPGLMLCDQAGTFFIRDNGKSYSLFDSSVATEIPCVDNTVTLPQEFPLSLHGHTFPVSAGCTVRNFCVTGDTSGYVNIWSPTISKLQL